MLRAGEPVRCKCCLPMIESSREAAEKHRTLVHAGDGERQWGAAPTTTRRPPSDPLSAGTTKLDNTRAADASDDALMLHVCSQ